MSFFDNIKNKYNFKQKNEITQEDNVDTIEEVKEGLEEKLEEDSPKLFEAFYTNNLGPTMYYLVEVIDNEYIFKYGYTKEGKLEQFGENELKLLKKDKTEYEFLISTIKTKTDAWQPNYNNGFILDGTKWYIKLINEKKEYEGTNDFPSNLKEVLSILESAFSKDKKIELEPIDSKKDEIDETISLSKTKLSKVKPHKIKYKKPKNNLFIEFKVKSNQDTYILKLDENNLLFDKLSNKEKNTPIEISINQVLDFTKKIENITSSWHEDYNGNINNNIWSLNLITSTKEKIIEGTGEYPLNWNDLIDLVSEYELIYKQLIASSNSNKKNKIESNQTKTNQKSKLDQYIETITPEINDELRKMNLLTIKDGKEYEMSGCSHARWNLQEKKLKEKYNVDWINPIKENIF